MVTPVSVISYAGIMKALKSVNEIYPKCNSPFDDRHSTR